MNFRERSYGWFRERFSEGVYEYGPNRMMPYIREYLGPVEGTVLDAACGSRNKFWESASMQCCDSIGLDVDEDALRKNNLHNKFLHLDVHDLDEANQYGGIISVYTWEHLQNPMKVLQNFHRALKAGGILVVIAPNRWSIKSMMERMTPPVLKDWAWRVLKGRSHMPFPVFHRLCTKRSLSSASSQVGLEFVAFKSIECPFLWFAKIPPLFILFAYWMVLANQFSVFEKMRSEFVAVMRKPEAEPGQA